MRTNKNKENKITTKNKHRKAKETNQNNEIN